MWIEEQSGLLTTFTAYKVENVCRSDHLAFVQ
ncbi:MAG: hypothetical protein JWQ96_1464 [Segetibacter sp.]|nr:hypothetical protein [Segetibacter sp.]